MLKPIDDYVNNNVALRVILLLLCLILPLLCFILVLFIICEIFNFCLWLSGCLEFTWIDGLLEITWWGPEDGDEEEDDDDWDELADVGEGFDDRDEVMDALRSLPWVDNPCRLCYIRGCLRDRNRGSAYSECGRRGGVKVRFVVE
jgi:hypothetical protein